MVDTTSTAADLRLFLKNGFAILVTCTAGVRSLSGTPFIVTIATIALCVVVRETAFRDMFRVHERRRVRQKVHSKVSSSAGSSALETVVGVAAAADGRED